MHRLEIIISPQGNEALIKKYDSAEELSRVIAAYEDYYDNAIRDQSSTHFFPGLSAYSPILTALRDEFSRLLNLNSKALIYAAIRHFTINNQIKIFHATLEDEPQGSEFILHTIRRRFWKPEGVSYCEINSGTLRKIKKRVEILMSLKGSDETGLTAAHYCKRSAVYLLPWRRNPSKALAYAETAVELAPDSPMPYMYRAEAWIAKAVLNHEKAIADYSTAILKNPECVTAYINRGVLVWADANNKFGISESKLLLIADEILKDMNKVIALSPTKSHAWMLAGQMQRFKKNVARAAFNYCKASTLILNSSCSALEKLHDCYFSQFNNFFSQCQLNLTRDEQRFLFSNLITYIEDECKPFRFSSADGRDAHLTALRVDISSLDTRNEEPLDEDFVLIPESPSPVLRGFFSPANSPVVARHNVEDNTKIFQL